MRRDNGRTHHLNVQLDYFQNPFCTSGITEWIDLDSNIDSNLDSCIIFQEIYIGFHKSF